MSKTYQYNPKNNTLKTYELINADLLAILEGYDPNSYKIMPNTTILWDNIDEGQRFAEEFGEFVETLPFEIHKITPELFMGDDGYNMTKYFLESYPVIRTDFISLASKFAPTINSEIPENGEEKFQLMQAHIISALINSLYLYYFIRDETMPPPAITIL